MNKLVIILLMVTLNGCMGIPVPYPCKVTDLPETKGQLIDKVTGYPVANVKLTLSKVGADKSWHSDEYRVREDELLQKAEAKTDNSGVFRFEEVSHWRFFKFVWITYMGTPPVFGSAMSLTYSFGSQNEKRHFEDANISPYFEFREEYNSFTGERARRNGPLDLGKLIIGNPNK